MNMVQRLPKWLLEESRAEIFVARGKPVCVRLLKGKRHYVGFGNSISAAAKNADAKRGHYDA